MRAPGSQIAWITGAGGLIGHHLVNSAPQYSNYSPRPVSRPKVDLLDFPNLKALFVRERPDLVVHCAAISKNPACQANPALAERVNVTATKLLAELASEIPFIFISTDLVFDGEKGNYREDDPTNPLSVYADTKLRAEQFVRRHPRHTILRISLTGGRSPTRDRGFNEEMENAWRDGKPLNLFIDEFRRPMAAVVTARVIWELAKQEPCGTVHLNGAEKLSRHQIGELLAARHPELNPQIISGSRKDYKGPPRPADTSMNCDKIKQLLSFPLPGFSQWLREHPGEPF